MLSEEDIDKKISELRELKKVVLAKKKAKERKERTRRLIQIGAIVEKYADTIESMDEWEKYIIQYAGYIKKTQAKSKEKLSSQANLAKTEESTSDLTEK